jgi:putative tricarboxylic transport membrane protein
MKVSRNQITGAALVVLGVVVIILTTQFNTPMTAAYPGPKLFPLIAAVGLIGLGVGIFFQKDDSNKIEISVTMVKRILFMILITALYILGLKYLGFILSTPVFLYVVAWLFSKASVENKSKWWHLLIFAVVVTVAIYCMYVYAFSLRLPRGRLTKF